MQKRQCESEVLAVLEAITILFASVLLNGPWYLSTARTGQNEHVRLGQMEATVRVG